MRVGLGVVEGDWNKEVECEIVGILIGIEVVGEVVCCCGFLWRWWWFFGLVFVVVNCCGEVCLCDGWVDCVGSLFMIGEWWCVDLLWELVLLKVIEGWGCLVIVGIYKCVVCFVCVFGWVGDYVGMWFYKDVGKNDVIGDYDDNLVVYGVVC